jgi:adenine nucleotide transporter 17
MDEPAQRRRPSLTTSRRSKSLVGRSRTLRTIFRILRDDGPLAFWQGVVPALILVVNPVIQYTVFERLKAYIQRFTKLTPWHFLLLGALSKLVATGITYPYIVVKSRMQLRQSKDPNLRYASVMDGFRKILRQEGVEGLYRGIFGKLLQSVLTAAFLFYSKERLYHVTTVLMVALGWKRVQDTHLYAVK